MDYTKCVTSDGKNYAAIEKIIAKRSYRDYITMNPMDNNGRKKYRHHSPYSLSQDTLEALEIKKQYLTDKITEEEYKAYCLRENMLNK